MDYEHCEWWAERTCSTANQLAEDAPTEELTQALDRLAHAARAVASLATIYRTPEES